MTFPGGFSTGQIVTAADMNGLWQVHARHDYLNTSQSIPDSAETTIIFSQTVFEKSLALSRTSGVYTVNKAGYWKVTAQLEYAADADGDRVAQIERNDFAIARVRIPAANTGGKRIMVTSPVVNMADTDNFRVTAFHNSGAALDVVGGQVSTWVSFEWIGPA